LSLDQTEDFKNSLVKLVTSPAVASSAVFNNLITVI